MVVLDEVRGSPKFITVHPEVDMTVCTKLHLNPSNGCRDISIITTNVKLTVALEKKSGDHQSHSI